jgi:putative addiction module antidote
MGGLTSKVRAQGASVVTTLPAEVARRLGIEAGHEVEWIEDGLGGFRVVRSDPKLEEVMKVHDQIMEEYGSVFRALAR